MSFPYFISPEQAMRERSELARKGISRGRSVVVLAYEGGVLFVAENPSRSLQKVSELYDRVGFAAVGRFNEFDNLRRGGIQYADTRGYAYDRRDVSGRQLANQYAQILGQVFTHEMKPMEVEILVAEVGADGHPDQLFHILYDGTVMDEHRFSVLGGDAEAITGRMRDVDTDLPFAGAVKAATAALAGPDRQLQADDLEVALLERGNGRRCFRRLSDDEVTQILAS